MGNSWFKKGFKQIEVPLPIQDKHDNTPRGLLDFNEAFESDSEIIEKKRGEATTSSMIMKPTCMNAFDIISLSQGFDLSGLFENDNNQNPNLDPFRIARETYSSSTKLNQEQVKKYADHTRASNWTPNCNLPSQKVHQI
ncbi:hypothetical protein CsSME_00029710 [Camellia sinensis var. sinensis]